MEWRERDGVRWLEAALPGAEVAFSTRIGGRSAPPYDTLNLGLLTGDTESARARQPARGWPRRSGSSRSGSRSGARSTAPR